MLKLSKVYQRVQDGKELTQLTMLHLTKRYVKHIHNVSLLELIFLYNKRKFMHSYYSQIHFRLIVILFKITFLLVDKLNERLKEE